MLGAGVESPWKKRGKGGFEGGAGAPVPAGSLEVEDI